MAIRTTKNSSFLKKVIIISIIFCALFFLLVLVLNRKKYQQPPIVDNERSGLTQIDTLYMSDSHGNSTVINHKSSQDLSPSRNSSFVDVIKSFGDSDVTIHIGESIELYLQKNTEITIGSTKSEDGSYLETTVQLDSGNLLINIKDKLTNKEKLLVKTNTFTISTNDATFRMNHIKDTNNNTYQYVEVFGGEIESLIANKETKKVKTNQAIIIKEGNNPDYLNKNQIDYSYWKENNNKDVIKLYENKNTTSSDELLNVFYENLPDSVLNTLMSINDLEDEKLGVNNEYLSQILRDRNGDDNKQDDATTKKATNKKEDDESSQSSTPAGPVDVVAPTVKSNLVYNGNELDLIETPALPIAGGVVNYSLTQTNTAPSIDTYSVNLPKATNAGTYYIWYYSKGTTADNDTQPRFVLATISKADANPVAPVAITGLVYNVNAQQLINVGSGTPSGTMMYKVSNDKPTDKASFVSTIENIRETNAGTYNVWYYVKGDDNNKESDISDNPVMITIDKAKCSIVAPIAATGIKYNGSEQELLSTYASSDGDHIGSVVYAITTSESEEPLTFSSDIPKKKEAGTYYVWYKAIPLTGDANHVESDINKVAVTVKLVYIYEKLEYIKTDGNSIIDTGTIVKKDITKIVIDMNITTNSNNHQVGAGAYGVEVIFYSSNNVYLLVDYLGARSFNMPINQRKTYIADAVDYKIGYEGNLVECTPTVDEALGTFALGGRKTSVDYALKGIDIIYSFKEYANDVLVKELIPVKRTNDDEIGMLDTVSKVFYSNADTGSFTYQALSTPEYINVEVDDMD